MSFKNIQHISFDKIEPYTKTTVVVTNIIVDIEKLLHVIPIVPYTILKKKRGRKKKEFVEPNVNQNIPSGSIIYCTYSGIQRGIKKNKNNSGTYFRNSMSIIMIINDKHINLKLSRNGRIQMTGCKNDEHILECIKYLWKCIKCHEKLYKLVNWSWYKNINSSNTNFFIYNHVNNPPFYYDNTLRAKIIPVMRNIYFTLGINIDRKKLDSYFNLNNSEFNSLLETSVGYTGVNIKQLVKNDITQLPILNLEEQKEGKWKLENDIYQDYLSILNDKERIKNMKKERYNTFLVFHSGKVILSSIHEYFSRDAYYDFLKIIDDQYDQVKEKLLL